MEDFSALEAGRVIQYKWQFRGLGRDELNDLVQRRATLEREAAVALDEVLMERGLPPPEQLARQYRGFRGFVARHYNGDYSLPRSYWVHVLLLSTVGGALLTGLLPVLAPMLSATHLSLLLILGIAALLATWVWGIVGTWRSADKHVARGGREFWAGLAKIAVVISLIRGFAEMVPLSPVLWEHVRVAFGEQPGGAVEFVLRADGKSLLLRGGINDHTAAGLEAALRRAPDVRVVVLESNGGWILQGQRIAEVIARRGLDTYVETECTSACTIAFLAGKERAVAPDARLGFHAFRGIGNMPSMETEAGVYGRAGLSDAFIRRVARTSHQTVWYPDIRDLLDEKILTRRSLGGETAALATTVKSRDELREGFLKHRLYSLLSNRHPQRFDAIVDAAWRALQDKRIDREVSQAARRELASFTREALKMADDATILSYVVLIADQAEGLRPQAPELCAEVIFRLSGNPVDLGGLLSKSLLEREQSLMAALIETHDPRNAVQVSEGEAAKTLRQVFSAMRPGDVRVIQAMRGGRTPGLPECNAGIAMVDALLDRPLRDRVRAARILLAS